MPKSGRSGEGEVTPAAGTRTFDSPKAVELQPLTSSHDRPDSERSKGPGCVGWNEGKEWSEHECSADRGECAPEAPPDAARLDPGVRFNRVEPEECHACRDGHSGHRVCGAWFSHGAVDT